MAWSKKMRAFGKRDTGTQSAEEAIAEKLGTNMKFAAGAGPATAEQSVRNTRAVIDSAGDEPEAVRAARGRRDKARKGVAAGRRQARVYGAVARVARVRDAAMSVFKRRKKG